MAGIPKSAVSLTIPPDSLRKLPSGSSYHSRNGQAGLTVKSDAAGNIIAEASCDRQEKMENREVRKRIEHVCGRAAGPALTVVIGEQASTTGQDRGGPAPAEATMEIQR